MTYPTMPEVEAADHDTLTNWYTDLKPAEPKQLPVLQRIINRLDELGGLAKPDNCSHALMRNSATLIEVAEKNGVLEFGRGFTLEMAKINAVARMALISELEKRGLA